MNTSALARIERDESGDDAQRTGDDVDDVQRHVH